MAKQNIYDREDFFTWFRNNRDNELNFNDCVETPVLMEMLPDLRGKKVLDIGCGMGQHAKQYSLMGAGSVLGIDISENMIRYAQEHNAAENVSYRRLAMEDIGTLTERYDLITSSLVFDYAEDFESLMRSIRGLMDEDAELVFSMSHPMATAWDGVYDRYTRTETGERLYANIHNYGIEGLRKVDWPREGYEYYHRTVSSLINSMVGAGLEIEECRESIVPEELRTMRPDLFGGTVHKPDFIFFRCRKGQI